MGCPNSLLHSLEGSPCLVPWQKPPLAERPLGQSLSPLASSTFLLQPQQSAAKHECKPAASHGHPICATQCPHQGIVKCSKWSGQVDRSGACQAPHGHQSPCKHPCGHITSIRTYHGGRQAATTLLPLQTCCSCTVQATSLSSTWGQSPVEEKIMPLGVEVMPWPFKYL